MVDPAEARSAAEAARRDALLHLERRVRLGARELRRGARVGPRHRGPGVRGLDLPSAARQAAAETAQPRRARRAQAILLRTREPQTAFRAAYSSASIYRLRKGAAKVFFYANLARRHAEELATRVSSARA